MKNIAKRKICLFALVFSFILCMVAGFISFSAYASVPIESFEIPGGKIKFAESPEYNGIRFPTLMSADDYNAYKDRMITGIILCDADKLGEDGKLSHEVIGGVDIDTTDLWKLNGSGVYEAGAFIYGIPDTTEGYLNEIAAVGYYKIDGGNAVYSNTIVRSAAQIAYEYSGRDDLFDDEQLSMIDSYLPDLTVKYVVDGVEVDSTTVRYGESVETKVVDDKLGYEFSSWQVDGIDYDFESAVKEEITLTAKFVEKTYVYGTGFDVTIGVPAFATLCENEITEGENAGKWYKSITKTSGSGASSFTVTATEEAGLEPNTVYLVSVVVDTDGAHPAYYREATNATVKYGERFYLSAGKQNVVFYITTDENGEFTKAFNNCYWNSGTYVNFSGLTVMKAAYSKGLQIVNYTNSQAKITESIVDSGNGTAIMQLNRKSDNGVTSLYINATSEAGLKANTSYSVTFTIKTNGKYYHEANPATWSVLYVEKSITFTITTDANGEFSQSYNTQMTEGTYAKFTNVTVEEVVG